MISVTWTGAAGLQFAAGEELILIDPYYTRVSILNTLFKVIGPDVSAIHAELPDLKRIDAVVVGHTHSDHALDVPHIAAHSRAKIVGSDSLATLMALNGQAGRSAVCRGGETVALTERATVTMFRSTHGLVAMGKVPFPGEIRAESQMPMKASGYRVGAVFAPRLTIDGTVFLHNGSANFIDEALQGIACDVLFLCVAGWKRRAGYPEDLIDMTRPQAVVLFHYDDFSRPHRPGGKTRMLPFMDLEGLKKRIGRVRQRCA